MTATRDATRHPLGRRRWPRGVGRDRLGIDPLWRRAPLALRHHLRGYVGLLLATAVLATVAASAPLFVGAAGDAALVEDLVDLPDFGPGLRLITDEPLDPARLDELRSAYEAAVGRLEPLGPVVWTAVSRRELVGADGTTERPVRLFARAGAVEALDVIARTGRDGVWLSEGTARRLDLDPAAPPDAVPLVVGQTEPDDPDVAPTVLTEAIPLAGTFRDLLAAPGPFWRDVQQRGQIPYTTWTQRQPEVAVLAPAMLEALAPRISGGVELAGDAPLADRRLTLPEAERLVDGYNELRRQGTFGEGPFGQALLGSSQVRPPITLASSLRDLVDDARVTASALIPPVQTLSFAGEVLALILVGAAAVALVSRRRVEVRLLAAQGASPLVSGIRASVESLPAVLPGAALGGLAAYLLALGLGPADGLDPTRVRQAVVFVGWLALVAVVLCGVMTARAVVRETRPASRLGQTMTRLPWDLVVLGIALLAYAQILLSPVGPSSQLLVLGAPPLLVGGLVGLGTRVCRLALPLLRRPGRRWSDGAWLAARRLAGAGGAALGLVAAAAVAVGLFTYAGVLAEATGVGLERKAAVEVGSRTALTRFDPPPLPGTYPPLGPLPDDGTLVRLNRPNVLPPGFSVRLRAIEPATFARAVVDGTFAADRPLEELLALLDTAEGPLPALAIGTTRTGETVPDEAVLESTSYAPIPLRVVARPALFPGADADRPLLVVSAAAVAARLPEAAAEVGIPPQEASIDVAFAQAAQQFWTTADVDAVRPALEDAGFDVRTTETVDDVLAEPFVRAQQWSLGYLRALGLLAAGLGLVGLLLYLEEREGAREVSTAMLRRMGLSRGAAHRAALVELGGLLLLAALLGCVAGLVAGVAVVSRLDPLPQLPPFIAPRIPWSVLGLIAVAVAVVTVVGAWALRRRADRTDVAGVLRAAP